jgi:hypothetical protein
MSHRSGYYRKNASDTWGQIGCEVLTSLKPEAMSGSR